MNYVKKFGRIDEMGRYVYEGKLSHYDIAKFLGINRVSVTNVVKELQESGIIQKERARLIILNTEYMKQLWKKVSVASVDVGTPFDVLPYNQNKSVNQHNRVDDIFSRWGFM